MDKRVREVEKSEFRIRLDERLQVLLEVRTMMEQKKRLVGGLKRAAADLDIMIERTYNALRNSQGGLPGKAKS